MLNIIARDYRKKAENLAGSAPQPVWSAVLYLYPLGVPLAFIAISLIRACGNNSASCSLVVVVGMPHTLTRFFTVSATEAVKLDISQSSSAWWM